MLRCYAEDWDEYISRCGFADDELEIIPFMRKGWAQTDIAAELCISLSTVQRRTNTINRRIIRYERNKNQNEKIEQIVELLQQGHNDEAITILNEMKK